MKAGHPAEIIRGVQEGKIVSLSCEGCSRCCTPGPMLTMSEARHFGVQRTANATPRLPCGADGNCSMLRGGLCSEYANRPAACREYDCRAVAIVELVRRRMGDEFTPCAAVRPDWEFDCSSEADVEVLDSIEEMLKANPGVREGYPIALVKRLPRRNEPSAVDELRLAAYRERVNMLAVDIKASARKTAEQVDEAGRLLIAAKDLVRHGEFKAWITANVKVPYRTAASWMASARGHRRDAIVDELLEVPTHYLTPKAEKALMGAAPEAKVQDALITPNETPLPPAKIELKTPKAVAELPVGRPQSKPAPAPRVIEATPPAPHAEIKAVIAGWLAKGVPAAALHGFIDELESVQ